MSEALTRALLFIAINLAIFIATYLYGYRAHPNLAIWFSLVGFVVTSALLFQSTAWLSLSVAVGLAGLFVMRKPDQAAAFQAFFRTNEITLVQQVPTDLSILGDISWKYSVSKFYLEDGVTIPYYFCQGYTSRTISPGGSSRMNYLLFVFPPNSLTPAMKKRLKEAANTKEEVSVTTRIRRFFSPSTDVPERIIDAPDGSLLVEFYTKVEVEVYEKQVEWVRRAVRV